MSVAAMTMDDQRPLMNSYDKMSSSSTKYEQNLHIISGNSGGVVGGGNGVGAGMSSVNTAPPSGPASPTPSGSEEQLANAAATVVAAAAGAVSTATSSSHHHHPHHNHHHHHHHHHHQQQQQQQQSQSQTTQHQEQQQREQQQQTSSHAAAIAEAVAVVEQRNRLLEDEIEGLKVEKTRLAQQFADAQRREKILMRRLANKEQEFQDYVSQIAEYKAQQAPTSIALRTALLDPAVNLLFERLKRELKATKAKLEETQNELSAWKFTPDSNTGKRLMAKCRLLYQENEELGKMTSNGRLAKLETELAMQKSFSEEVKKSQSELDDFLQELDEDVEGMQSTILFLQQELKQTRDRVQILEKENYQIKNGSIESEVDATLVTSPLPEQTKNGNDNDNGGNGTLNGIGDKCGVAFVAPQSVVVLNNNNEQQFNKYQQTPIKLETINEHECLPTPVPLIVTPQSATLPPSTSTITHTTSNNNAIDYYNGSVVHDQQQQQQQHLSQTQDSSLNLVINDENSNGSKSGRLSRKRNYEEDISVNYITATTTSTTTPNANVGPLVVDSNDMISSMPPTREISTPRTLPPKKSKLRGITTRRSSQLEENLGVGGGTSPLIQPAATPHIGMVVVDNAVAGMASEEFSGSSATTSSDVNMVAATAAAPSVESEATTTPARILTRRRSVRQLQQNGGGGGGGDY